MKRTNKKGFTIVELVVVIAIIAILAAVLIPTFASLIKRANVSKDNQLIRNMNTALIADKAINGEHKTMQAAIDVAIEAGYSPARINKSSKENEILWDSVNDVFCYYNADSKNPKNIDYVPETKLTTSVDKLNAWDYFMIVDVTGNGEVDLSGTYSYSVYLRDVASTVTAVKHNKGVDVGENTVNVNYVHESGDEQKVIIRTNSANTNLTINAEPDTVNHYGNVGKVDAQKIDMNCYNEYGTAAYVKVTEGKVVAKDGGKIAVVFANNTDQTKVAVAKETNGTIGRGLTTVQIVDETNFEAYQVHLEYSVDGITPSEESIEAIVQSAISDLLDEEVAEQVVRAVTSDSTEYYSFSDFAKKVNNGTLETKGTTFTLMANVDLKNVEWTPIGTSEHPFAGIFDGNGYTIKNFKISSSNARGEDALFGFVVGDTNMDAIDLAARWKLSTYSFNTSNVETLYTAVVKNFTVSGATVSSAHAENKTNNASGTNLKSTAAAIGLLRCGYAENIIVDDSTVNGYKTVGGVIGSLDGGSIDNCKTTSSVTINGYSNIGGIVGGLENANAGSSSGRQKHSIISNCENNATINKITEDQAYGYVGGIIGTAQNDKSAVVACVVNGVIHSVNNGSDPVSGTYGAVGGVIGQTGSGGYFISLTNNATMMIEGAHGYVGGITEYSGSSNLYNCVNNANITANAIQLAGIMAGAQTGNTTYISCVNNGALVNTSGAVSDISSANGVALIENQTFATVGELQAALNAQNLDNCTNIKLINVTVTDTTGALSIPAKIEAITSDQKVCSTITLVSGRERGLSVQMPGIDYTYDASNVIWFNVEGGNITVPAEITVPSLSVKGASSVTIDGIVTNGVSATNVSTITNNGTIGYISLGASSKDITFNNNGEIGGVDGSAHHSVCTVSKVNLTINNRGTIKAGEGNYALLFYGNSTVVFNAYQNSTITKAEGMGALAINNGPSAHAKLVTFNVASGADGVENNKYYGSSSSSSSTYECKLVVNFDADLQ